MKDVNTLTSNGVNVEGSLELFGDMETYDETLIDFLETIDEKLSNIKKYKEVADMPNYAILVHSLKSDSRYLGFTKLAELSYQHELESKANNMLFVYNNYEELMNEANRILKVVQTYLGKETASATPEPIATEKRDKTVLVVDDSNMIRNLIIKMFANEFEILEANDGQEALEIIQNTNQKLYGMLLDLNMPNVNGFAVLEYFQQNKLFTQIPVAIITGDDSRETVQKAFTYPIVDVLAKPFNERDVKRVVTAMINFH